MTYLDEQIEVKLTNLNVPSTGSYQYRIIDNTDGAYIYIGNTFIEAGNNITKTFNITDIVSNYSYINKAILDNETHKEPIIKTYTVQLYLSATNIIQGTSDDIYLAYRYPHLLKRLELNEGNTQYNIQSGLLPVYPNNYSDNYSFNFNALAKGSGQKVFSIEYSHNGVTGLKDILSENGTVNISKSIKLSDLEDYPLPATDKQVEWTVEGPYLIDEKTFEWEDPRTLYINVEDSEDNMHIIGTLEIDGREEYKTYRFDTNIGGIQRIVILDENYNDVEAYITPDGFKTSVIFTLEASQVARNIITRNVTILKWDKEIPTEGITLKVNNDKIKIGEFCDNIDGYYLQWQDRLGSLQSQHFEGNPKFSIDYESTSITNYRGEKRNINTNVTSKWEINSGWISEKYYPYYESIFVSPYLKLYDVKEDKSYDVVISDNSYEEKTFHNQGRQLFNIKLNLEKNTKQNILY